MVCSTGVSAGARVEQDAFHHYGSIMLIEVADSDTARTVARGLEEAGYVAYVPTLRFKKNRHLVQVADFVGHERVAGLQAQRVHEVVRKLDPAARPLG